MPEPETGRKPQSGTWVAVNVGIGGVLFTCGVAGIFAGPSFWGGVGFAALGAAVFVYTIIRG